MISTTCAQFNNYFAGAQVVEIIVKDPNRIDTDEAESEPTVRVNEHPIRMVQGSDGYWYAYIVESNEVGATQSVGTLSYGAAISSGHSDTENRGIYDHDGSTTLTFNSNITVYAGSSTTSINVVDNAPSLTSKIGTVKQGQIGVSTTQWPFIQAMDFTLENIDIVLEQPGTDEVVSLKHDNDDIDDFAGIELDRSGANNGACSSNHY